MKRRNPYRPSPLTVLGVYSRHLCNVLGVTDDELGEVADFLPDGSPALISFRPPAEGTLAQLSDPAFWGSINAAASEELGQPIVTRHISGRVIVVQDLT